MEKPNRENYYKDLEYFDKSAGKYFDNYLYEHDLEKYIKHLENKVNNVVSDDVISCLPTDVEISDYSKQKYLYRKSPCGTYYEGKQKGFYEGAEWLKDKLNNL